MYPRTNRANGHVRKDYCIKADIKLDKAVRADRGFVLVQNLIVFAHRYTEDDRRHVLKAVNPLLTL